MRMRWSSSLRENRNSSLKFTRLQSVTLQLAPGRQKFNRNFLWCGVSGSRLIGRLFLRSASTGRLQMFFRDTTGCLERAKWRRTNCSDVVLEDVAYLIIARSLRAIVFLGLLTHWDAFPFCDPLLPRSSNYHITPTELAADMPVRSTYYSEAYYTLAHKVLQLFIVAGYVSEACLVTMPSIQIDTFMWITLWHEQSCF